MHVACLETEPRGSRQRAGAGEHALPGLPPRRPVSARHPDDRRRRHANLAPSQRDGGGLAEHVQGAPPSPSRGRRPPRASPSTARKSFWPDGVNIARLQMPASQRPHPRGAEDRRRPGRSRPRRRRALHRRGEPDDGRDSATTTCNNWATNSAASSMSNRVARNFSAGTQYFGASTTGCDATTMRVYCLEL